MQIFSRRLVFALSVVGLTGLGADISRADAPVSVLVSADQTSSTITYRYTLINNSTESFNNVVIGSRFDATQNDTFPELGKLPIGWQSGSQGETGTSIVLDPTSTTQPSGWTASVYGQEETAFFYLDWRNSGGAAIQPGQTLSGFSVAVQKGRDPNLIRMPADFERKYLNGHFTVTLPSGTEVHGDIERLDVTPPSLSVSATPASLWPPNGKLVPITIKVTVSDDYDSSPEVRLESITANESISADEIGGAELGTDDRQFSLAAKRAGSSNNGRVYTITYSATDASGNMSTATTTVVVPHDQGK